MIKVSVVTVSRLQVRPSISVLLSIKGVAPLTLSSCQRVGEQSTSLFFVWLRCCRSSLPFFSRCHGYVEDDFSNITSPPFSSLNFYCLFQSIVVQFETKLQISTQAAAGNEVSPAPRFLDQFSTGLVDWLSSLVLFVIVFIFVSAFVVPNLVFGKLLKCPQKVSWWRMAICEVLLRSALGLAGSITTVIATSLTGWLLVG